VEILLASILRILKREISDLVIVVLFLYFILHSLNWNYARGRG